MCPNGEVAHKTTQYTKAVQYIRLNNSHRQCIVFELQTCLQHIQSDKKGILIFWGGLSLVVNFEQAVCFSFQR